MTSKLSSILVAAVAASLFAGQYGRADAAALGANPQAFKQPANAITFGVQPQATGKTCRVHPPGNVSPYLFANDNVTANVYEYCEDMPPNPTSPRLVFSSPTGFGGWGLAVSPDALGPAPARERLAVGTYGGAVNVFNVTNTGLLTQQKTLLLAANSSMRGNALGICFDGTGGLYATNYPYAEVDYFNNAAVVGGAAAPTTRFFTSTAGAMFTPTYLACDYDQLIIKGKRPPNWENIVMVDGIDNAGNADVGQLTATGVVNVMPGQVLGPYGPGGHFPGGMTIDRRDDLVVSDWYGSTLLNFGPKEPWPAPISVCKTGGSATNDSLLPIDFDDGQREIWGGNSFTSSSPGANANAVSVPFPFKSSCGTRGESGGPTATLQQTFFLGIAVWPNTGV